MAFSIGEREIFVNHESKKRSGHMGHAMVDAGNGRILDFYSNVDYDRVEGHSGYGWMEYRVSEDYGRTFGETRVLPYSKKVFDEGIHTALCEKAVKAPDGRILLFFQITDASLPIACEPWSPPTMIYSLDGGETFSEEIDLHADAGRIYDAIADDKYVYFLMEANEHFLGTRPEHVFKVYRSEDFLHFEPIALPIDAFGKGYGALGKYEDGSIITYVYDSNRETEPEYTVSHDQGLTWSAPRRAFVDQRIRNPQLQRVGSDWFLVGRNGGDGDGLVLYHSTDGISWSKGVMVDRRPEGTGCGYYSNMLPIFEPGEKPRILLQYSHVYNANRVNIAHRVITIG